MDISSFLATPGKVIITDQVANIDKLLRRMNRMEDRAFVDVHVLPIRQIAQEFITAYSALYEPDHRYRFLSPAMRTMLLHEIIEQEDLQFVPRESRGIQTSSEVMRILDQIRLNQTTEDYVQAADVKLTELKDLISKYENRIAENDELDEPAMLQKACQYLDALLQRGSSADTISFFLPWIEKEIGVDGRLECTALEAEFLTKLKLAAGKDFAEPLVITGSQAGEEGEGRNQYHFLEAYGICNEVRYAAEKIQENRVSYGDVLVIYGAEQYENVLRAELESRNIPYTFPKGYHATSSDYVSFMLDLIAFVQDDYSYQSLEKVITNPICTLKGARRAYRTVLNEGIGWKRERYEDFIGRFTDRQKEEGQDVSSNEEGLLQFVAFLTDILAAFSEQNSCREIYVKLIALANTYTYKADKVRIGLTEDLKQQAKAFAVAPSDNTFAENVSLIADYLGQLRFAEAEKTDSVAIYPYGTPLYSDRKVLFALGLSNENIAGTKAESPILSDEELQRYVNGKLDLAAKRNARKRQYFEDTLETFGGGQVYIGYSSYDTVGLLDNSRSLLYNDLLLRYGQEADIEKIGYSFMQGNVKLPLEDFYQANEDPDKTVEDGEAEALIQTPAYFSASSLQTLLYCPLQYYYKKIEHVPDVQFAERTPDRWMQANQKGNLFHHTMEAYVNEAIIQNGETSRNDALLDRLFEQEVEEVRKQQPVPSETIFRMEYEESKVAVMRYAEQLHQELNESAGKKVIGCEVGFENYPCQSTMTLPGVEGEEEKTYSYQIAFSGSLDRVDGYMDGTTLHLEIIDYKTGRVSNKQAEIDEGVQIQHYVYAICLKEWANRNIDTLQSLFGCEIHEILISSMKYVFPFDEDLAVIDVSSEVEDLDKDLPEDISYVLMLTVGAMQSGDNELAFQFMDDCARSKIYKAREEKQDFCQYCSYQKVCRKTLGSSVGENDET